MFPVAEIYLLMSFVLSGIADAEFTPEDCGDIQHNVENGMIRLPDFSGEIIRDLNCSWTYAAAEGRKLLIKVDSVYLPPLESRQSQLQLYIDDRFYDIPRNCVKCLREVIGGNVLNVIFTSYIVPESHTIDPLNASTNLNSIGSFQIRYRAFDPHRCGNPEQVENGFVVNKGRKVGQSVFYHCNPPYDLIGDSELQCILTPELLVPDWNSKAPKCTIPDCTGETFVKLSNSGAIASPGYPTYIHPFTAPCVWEIIAQQNQQIKVNIKYLRFPKQNENSFSDNSLLSFTDGNTTVLNLTETISNNSISFTTLTNKLTIQFSISENAKNREETGFYLDYSLVSISCPEPETPEHGEVITHSTNLGSIVTYNCEKEFVLVGEMQAECLFNGQWSQPTPFCEHFNENLPPFLTASNDSDSVTEKLAFFLNSTKLPKSTKVKAIESSDEGKFQNNGEPNSVGNNKMSILGKKSDLENGPKSEPHLLQEKGKKKTEKKMILNSTLPTPTPESSEEEESEIEINIAGFKLNLLMVYIITGVGLFLVLLVIILTIVIIYRRRYPVRMRFGRKFSTFENPMYVSKDAQHPRELKRLTT